MRCSLRKWYFDCVADDGTAWIGYRGELRWGVLRFPFASSLHAKGDAVRVTSTRRAEVEPRWTAETLSWAPASLQVNAEFSSRLRIPPRTLHPDVTWHCAMPLGEGTVRVNGEELRGLGYAEQLEMTLAPWKLPVASLRWGRFTSARTSLVWIAWEGRFPLMLAVRDGVTAEVSTIGDESIALDDGTAVAFRGRRPLRSDALSTTLAPLGPLARLLPRRLLGAVEEKWIGRGSVTRGGRTLDEGWVIHEHFTFGPE